MYHYPKYIGYSFHRLQSRYSYMVVDQIRNLWHYKDNCARRRLFRRHIVNKKKLPSNAEFKWKLFIPDSIADNRYIIVCIDIKNNKIRLIKNMITMQMYPGKKTVDKSEEFLWTFQQRSHPELAYNRLNRGGRCWYTDGRKANSLKTEQFIFHFLFSMFHTIES